MKPRHKRLYILLIAIGLIGASVAIVIKVFNENLVFFYSPVEIHQGKIPKNKKIIRMGGMVMVGSVNRSGGDTTVSFVVTDNIQSITVKYKGILPDLFREGKGVVVQGTLDKNQVFVASQVLAKHDENYMPPEVAEALRDSK